MTKALAVDDETVSRILLTRMLEALGLDVVEASDVPEAVERIRANSFDLIVSDYVMPSGTGLELAERAAELAIPFILLTGFGEEDDLHDARTGLVDVHLTKPVSSTELADAVARTGLQLSGHDN